MGKIKTLAKLAPIIDKLKKSNKCIAFTNGCFDLLHPGHLKTFRRAKKDADILVVGVNSDSSVKTLKGAKRPVMPQKARAQMLEAIEMIDYIIIFKDETPLNIIKRLRPHILVKGGDWEKSRIAGNEYAKKTIRVKLAGGYSTTSIISKIKKSG